MSVLSAKPAVTFEMDAQLVRQLLVELEHEQAALIVANIDKIESLIDKRLVLLQQLSVTAKNRYDALAAHGFEANEKGMMDWLNKQSNSNLKQAWSHFQKSLLNAKEMNRLNGVLINKHFNRNQQLLGQIQGKSAQENMYGKHGQTKSQFYKRNVLSV